MPAAILKARKGAKPAAILKPRKGQKAAETKTAEEPKNAKKPKKPTTVFIEVGQDSFYKACIYKGERKVYLKNFRAYDRNGNPLRLVLVEHEFHLVEFSSKLARLFVLLGCHIIYLVVGLHLELLFVADLKLHR